MEIESDTLPFYRSLAGGVVVRCDGIYDDGEDSPEPVADDPERPVGRVVLELPDFLADSLARMIVSVWEFADQLTGGPCLVHAPDREVAEALQAAVLCQPGNRCRSADPKQAQQVLADEATPAAVRAALLPEDVARFDQEFRAALAQTGDTFDLAAVDACLYRWRLVARSSADPVAERQMRQQAARLLAGDDIPTVPWPQVGALNLDGPWELLP